MNARWLFVVSLLFLTACSDKPIRTAEQTEQEFYQEVREALEDNNFLTAIDKLKQLEARYPFGRYAEQAQLELMYANYQTSNFDAVLADTERFIRLNPLHEQVDYAYYMRGLATYELAFNLVEKYLSDEDDPDQRDATPLRDAYGHFADLLDRFPDSQYAGDARARMVFLRNRIAQTELSIARYYMKRHAFLAVANRCNNLLLSFQKTDVIGDALALQTEAYQQLGLTAEADKTLALLQLNFPDHPQLESGQFEPSGLTEEDRRTLIGVMTFGLID